MYFDVLLRSLQGDEPIPEEEHHVLVLAAINFLQVFNLTALPLKSVIGKQAEQRKMMQEGSFLQNGLILQEEPFLENRMEEGG